MLALQRGVLTCIAASNTKGHKCCIYIDTRNSYDVIVSSLICCVSVMYTPQAGLEEADPKLYHAAFESLKKLRQYLADREGIANTHTLFANSHLEDIAELASRSCVTSIDYLSKNVKGVAMSKWTKYGDLILGVSSVLRESRGEVAFFGKKEFTGIFTSKPVAGKLRITCCSTFAKSMAKATLG